MFVDRKKLALTLAVVVATVLIGIMMVLAVIRNNATESPSTPTPTIVIPTSAPPMEPAVNPNYLNPDNPTSQEPRDNQYLPTDEGYLPLPRDFSPVSQSTKETVYDLVWAHTTEQRLYCELKNRPIATARSIRDLRNFTTDIRQVNAPETTVIVANAQKVINLFEASLGSPVPEPALNIINYSCTPPEEHTD